jgi:glutamyl-tRNA reductase
VSLILLEMTESDLGSEFDAYALDRGREAPVRARLKELIFDGVLDEAILVGTCARTEVYVLAGQFHHTVDELGTALAVGLGRELEELQSVARVRYGKAAIRHLLRVASGLESTILGESEILAQVKQALAEARAEGLASGTLGRYFERALEVAKRVRTETTISVGNVSVTSTAAVLALQEASRVAVIGSGPIGTEVARVLLDRGAKVTVLSANSMRRLALAAELTAATIRPLEELAAELEEIDTLVVAGSSVPLALDAEALKAARGLRIIDLCRPRMVDPLVVELDGVRLFDLDDVNQLVNSQLSERSLAREAASQIVEEELERFAELVVASETNPVLGRLHAWSEEVRRAELERTLQRLGVDDERVARELDLLTHRLTNKLLHRPSTALRQAAADGDFARFLEHFRSIFGL